MNNNSRPIAGLQEETVSNRFFFVFPRLREPISHDSEIQESC